MENHLIIGLGGTGGRVLAAFRKIMFERFNGDVKPKDMCIDYLYVDSSEQDLKMKDPAQWTIMGSSVSLPKDSVVQIPAANLREYVENKSRYKYLEPWLGNCEDWKNIISDPKIGEGAAGQKRRLGRLLFANGAPEFNRMVDVKVANLGNNNSSKNGKAVIFHVVAGLAGGTGSGCIVDVVAQLSKQTANIGGKVILYLLLPEEGKTSWASTQNYKPNGYVALTELNALEVKVFEPWDLSERLYDVKKVKSELPFYSAYLITDTNRNNIKFDVNKVVPATIAEFIYQKTVGVALGEKKPGRTESDANFFNDAEKEENNNYAAFKNPTHSHKFCGFGIKRLAIPEQEIKEYFGYNFAHQAVLKMLYRNWSSESGYVAEALTNDDYAFVIDPKNKQKWCITRDHLCLSKPIIEEHKWKSFAEEYGNVDTFKRHIMDDDEIVHAEKLIAIRNRTKRFFEKEFRPLTDVGQNGVDKFFKDKTNHGKEAIVEAIMEKINNDLFQLWITGERSLYELSGIVQKLLKYFEEEKDNLADMITRADTEIKLCEKKMNQIYQEWCDMSAVTKFISNHLNGSAKDDLVQKYTDILKQQYLYRTWARGYEFARILIDDLTNSVQVIKGDIERATTQMQYAQEFLLGAINSRCQNESEDGQSKNGVVIKEYDAEKVQTMVKGAISFYKDNDERIKYIMSGEGIGKLLTSQQHNFREVADKLSVEALIKIFGALGEEQATNFFTNEIGKTYIPKYEPQIGVNIIEKLSKKYGANDEGLKDLLERLVNHAAITNQHRDIERNNGPEVKSSMFVILPDYDKAPEFLQKIETLLKEFTSEGNVKVSRGGNSNEIVVVTLETNLTPRYLQNVYTLKNEYERLMSSENGHIARFETQLEDYKGVAPISDKEECKKLNILPSLYEATGDDKVYIDKIKQDIGDSQMSMVGNVNNTSTQMSPSPQVSMYVHKEDGQYVLKEGWRYDGPYDYKACGDFVQKGLLTSQTLVWQEGMATWQPAGEVPELKSLFVPVPPVPPTPSSMPPIPPTL